MSDAELRRVDTLAVGVSSLREMLADRERMIRERDDMARALAPFAALAASYSSQPGETLLVWISDQLNITVGMLRDAALASGAAPQSVASSQEATEIDTEESHG